MTGKEVRINRIRERDSGNYVIVPMDHGVTVGPIKGIKDLDGTINEIARGGGDSVLIHKGAAKHQYQNNDNEIGLIVHLNAATTVGPDPNNKVIVGDVKNAVRLGADAASFHINIGSETEPQQLRELGELADQCNEYGLPLLVMTYVRGPDVDSKDEETIAHAARLGAELGGDIIKAGYTGNPEQYRQVIEGCPAPVLIAGGPKADSKREALRDIRDAMDIGARGVCIGRNIFQQDDIAGMTNAISMIVHEDRGVDDAIEASMEVSRQ